MKTQKFLFPFFAILLFVPSISLANTTSGAELVTNRSPLLTNSDLNLKLDSLGYLRGQTALNFAMLGDFERALQIAQSIDGPLRGSLLRDIATELAAAGEVEKALALSENREEILGGVAVGLGRRGELSRALAIAEGFADPVKVQTLRQISH